MTVLMKKAADGLIGCGRKIRVQVKKEHLHGRRIVGWFNEQTVR